MRERAVERGLIRRVKDMGGSCHKLLPFVEAGLPDRMVLLPGGRIFLLEVKATGEGLRPAQEVWHRRAAALGIEVVTLAGAAEVKAWCEEVAKT